MNLQNISKLAAAQLYFDGYKRMTFEDFSKLDFIQKLSWQDGELGEELIAEGIHAPLAGYCEWATGSTNPVSIGWAWFDLADGRRFIAPGGISSNIMLMTSDSYDLGTLKTGELLQAWLAQQPWQAQPQHSTAESAFLSFS